jgi:hypothetical protein
MPRVEGLSTRLPDNLLPSISTEAVLEERLYRRRRPLVLYAGLFWLANHLFVIGYEEPTLRRRFGPSYEAYCAAVPRWVPQRPRTRALST